MNRMDQSLGLASRRGSAIGRRHDHLFYTGMSLAIIVAVFVGFAPTYYLKGYFHPAPLAPLVHLHGFVFTTWILLFLVQTVLVARDRTDLHRKLGLAGAILAATLVLLGLTTAVAAVRYGSFAAGGVELLRFLAVPLGDILVFAVLASAGIYLRRRPEPHKRLMLLATISLLNPAVGRWPLAILQGAGVTASMASFAITDLFLVAGLLYDLWSRGRVQPAYVWGGLFLILSQPLRIVISNTDAWLAIAHVLAGTA